MDILEHIAAVKREEVKSRKISNPVGSLEKSEFFRRRMPSFHSALAKPAPSIIGEFKRKSPSKGDINPSADVNRVATGYQLAGIDAISVLTDEHFFGGKNDDLQAVAEFLKIPALRKDFIVDEYQVVEAKSIGAAAILLIASILTPKEVDHLSQLARELGMDILFEIHELKDLDKLSQNIKIVGVNNRDLKTFNVSMKNSDELIGHLPSGCLRVAESGFKSFTDVITLYDKGYDAFLIGESFMKTVDPGLTAAAFINNLKSAVK